MFLDFINYHNIDDDNNSSWNEATQYISIKKRHQKVINGVKDERNGPRNAQDFETMNK